MIALLLLIAQVVLVTLAITGTIGWSLLVFLPTLLLVVFGIVVIVMLGAFFGAAARRW